MARGAVLALALLAYVAMANASRMPSFGFDDGDWKDIMLGRLRSDDPNRRREEKESKAFLAIRFNVPPNMHDDFIDRWHKLEDEARHYKSNVIFSLKKPVTDNKFFYHYQEWESKRDVMDFFESKSFEDFKDWVEKQDIELEVLPLKAVTDTDQERREMRKGGEAGKGKGKGKSGSWEDDRTHVLIRYHVPPSLQDDFIDTWMAMAKDTWGEDDNIVYSLRKVATRNDEYWGYGSWEDMHAYGEHFHSKHLLHFTDAIGDHGITWYLAPLEAHDSEKGR